MKLANPFLTAGYAGPEYFCDRKREAEALIGHLDNDRNTTLISPRRYGKTGLIQQVLHLLSKRRGVKTVYVDLYPTRSLQDFARALAVAVAQSVESPADKMLRAVSAFARGFRPTMTLDELTGRPKFSFDITAANAQASCLELRLVRCPWPKSGGCSSAPRQPLLHISKIVSYQSFFLG